MKSALIGALLVVAASPAAAQSWGAGVVIEGPVYYGAPAFERAVPLPPDVVFDVLEDRGYHDFGPMAPRGPIYRLTAVNWRGDLVELEVSAFSAGVESERILAFAQRPPVRVYRSAPAAHPQPPAPPPVYEEDDAGNPLVVY
jgi:hypothetical protein